MGMWLKSDPILSPSGQIIRGGMWQHQRNWWGLDSFVKALITGYGGGKTFIGCKWAIAMALTNAPSPFLVVSPSYKIAKRTIIPTIKALLAGKRSLDPKLWYKFNKTDHEFIIRWRGREAKIWIASGDNPDSLKGPNVCGALIDEPFIQDEDVLIQCVARVRDPIAKILQIGLTGTPETLNWGYDICEGERQGEYDIKIVHASTRDNLALSTRYADSLEGALSEKAAQAYVGGHFVNLAEGIVYYSFDNRVGGNNIFHIDDPGFELGVGMDFNVNPMAAMVFWRKGNHIHFTHEIELPNSDTHAMCQYLQRNFQFEDGPNKGRCRITKVYPDATGHNRSTKAPSGITDHKIIESYGFQIDAGSTNPIIRDRENDVNGGLKPADGSGAKITFEPTCKKIRSYLTQYTHEEKNTPRGKKMSHLIDATGYPVSRLIPVYKPELVTKQLLA